MMRAVSVRQPWAGAIVSGWKPVENRGRQFASLVGPGLVLIHAGLRFDDELPGAVRVIQAAGHQVPDFGAPSGPPAWQLGAIVGAVQITGVHRCDGSCAPGWAQPDQWHHQLAHARPLRFAVPCPGRLGPFTPDDRVLEEVRQAWPR